MRGKLRIKDVRNWPSDKVSGRVLIILIALSVVVFGAFYVIGFDMPFDDDANFNAPLFTDVVLVFMYILLAVAIVVAVVAMARAIKMRNNGEDVTNGVPAARITYGTVGLFVASLVLTFAFGSSEPMKINGETYSETFWLKATDMFINTSFILMFVAVVAVCYGLSGRNRDLRIKSKE